MLDHEIRGFIEPTGDPERMDPFFEQAQSLLDQHACENDHARGPVPDLVILGYTQFHHQFRDGVGHFHFF